MNNAKRDSEEVIEIIKKCDNNEMLIIHNIESIHFNKFNLDIIFVME